MVNKLKRLCVFSIILLLLFTVSCSKSNNNSNQDTSDNYTSKELSEQNKFDDFTNEIFINDVQTNTLNLHYTLSNPEDYGITDYPITLGTLSKEYFDENVNDLENSLHNLSKFYYDNLTQNQQITYDILHDYITTELSASNLYLYYEPLGASLGDQAQLPIYFAEYTFNNKNDVDDYLELLSEVDTFFSDIIAFENEKVNAGLFMSDEMVDSIISQCNKFISNPDSNYLIEVFNDKIDSLDKLTDKEKILYKEQNQNIIHNDLIPAYNNLINTLTTLKGNGKNTGGLCNFEHGKEYYEYLVKSNTGSSKSVSEITAKVEQKIKSDLSEMSTLVINNPDLIDKIGTYSFEQTEPDDIISTLIENMKNDFPSGPDVNYEFKYVHESLEDDLSPAFYMTPPIDNYKDNTIYINGSDNYANQDLFTTIAHEGYPGHLYQTTYFNSTNPSPIRSLLGCLGYVEGWATYTEIYSYNLSGLDENVANLLALNTSYSLGIYSRIDIGVNYDGWTLDTVNSYLSDFGITDTSIAKEIYDCMIESPGNYLNYYVGYLEILELKDIAKESLGDNFHVKDFHKFMLDMGPAPYNIILKYLNNWISTY